MTATGNLADSPRIIRSSHDRTRQAIADLINGAQAWRVWSMTGSLDIRQRYRRTMIGPFWITLSMAVMVATLGVLYSSLFKLEISEFIPYLAAGFCIWFLIAAMINEGTTLFVQADGIIRNTSLPIATHVYRLMTRNLITFAHNAVVMVAVYFFFHLNPGPRIFLAIPGLVLVMCNLAAIALVLGAICARFRDAPPIVSNLVQIAFFVTPILYRPHLLDSHLTPIADWNPFYHLVEIVRAPLLGQPTPESTYLAIIVMTAISWTVALLFYGRFRSRIPYWM